MPRTKLNKEMVLLNVKIPREMYNKLLEIANRDTHTSLSEVVRDALREWIERRAK
jgi:Arc/MetJ-type ribon-helix-helix transcriptional regulator